MELYIFDSERKMAGIVQAYEYLRWTCRYSRCGSFELKAFASDENIALLQIGNILWKNDDEEAGIMEFVELTMQEQEFVMVSGRFATCFLSRRIVWATEALSGDLSSGVDQLLNHHLIAPVDSDRVMNGISYKPASLGKPINTQISYQNLMDSVADLCETADVGVKAVFSPATGNFKIILYIGSDTQSVFSKEYENIIDQVFTRSMAEHANTALVGGEGDGPNWTFVVTGGSGEERYEIFVDAKDLRAEDFPDDYAAALLFRGNAKLAERAMVQAFEVTVNSYGNLRYKTDFDIGSKIQAVSKRWNIRLDDRITEIEESHGRDGMSLSVTFGKPLLTLAQKLKGGI